MMNVELVMYSNETAVIISMIKEVCKYYNQ